MPALLPLYSSPLTPPGSSRGSSPNEMPPLAPIITRVRRRGRTRGPGPTLLPCSVCGDMAPDHMHYGGIACFSCRAFFRRSVDKSSNYQCLEGMNCTIGTGFFPTLKIMEKFGLSGVFFQMWDHVAVVNFAGFKNAYGPA